MSHNHKHRRVRVKCYECKKRFDDETVIKCVETCKICRKARCVNCADDVVINCQGCWTPRCEKCVGKGLSCPSCNGEWDSYTALVNFHAYQRRTGLM